MQEWGNGSLIAVKQKCCQGNGCMVLKQEIPQVAAVVTLEIISLALRSCEKYLYVYLYALYPIYEANSTFRIAFT